MNSSKAGVVAGQLRQPGIMTLISGRRIDLANCTLDDIDITDIAWGLGRTLRYGGHIRQDYTVAHHSIVMSYVVDSIHAKEALLHDAAEAYIGDIIWPFKCLFPEVAEFENVLLGKIMKKFGVDVDFYGDEYRMSFPVKDADQRLMEHECFDQGIRPGIFHNDIESAWLFAGHEHETYWYAGQYAFLERFDELFGTNHLNLKELTRVWFPDEYERDYAGVPDAEEALELFEEELNGQTS